MAVEHAPLVAKIRAEGATTPAEFLQKLPQIIWDFGKEFIQLPTKDAFLRLVENACNEVLESTEFPIADDVLDRILMQAILAFASKIYDQLDTVV